MKIGIIGTGYVGIVSGSCFAEKGHDVICFDVDVKKVEKYSRGESAIYEPGLEELLKKNLAAKTLSFTTDIVQLTRHADVIFLCVGTPPLPDGSADLSQVESAVRTIAEHTPPASYKVIVEKSTVPVGTHKRLKNITKLYNKHKSDFDFVVNSEFLKEGTAIDDFLNPDRVVIGAESDKAAQIMLDLYKPFDTRKVVVDPASAEIIKYASNSFLAMKISFINMVADLCEKTGADIAKVADGVGFDSRIGRPFLNAGIGYGGSCFPKDVKAFIRVLNEQGVDASILHSTEDFNQNRTAKITRILEEELWILKNKDLAIWGLAFKPGTDDIREAPAVKVVETLLERGVRVRLTDPEAMENFKRLFPESDQVSYWADPVKAAENVEALIVMTDWNEYKQVKIEDLYQAMTVPVVVDGRNIFNEDQMISQGFRYFPIGKGRVLDIMKESR